MARHTRSWFDKLTTNGFSRRQGYRKQENALSTLQIFPEREKTIDLDGAFCYVNFF